MRYLLQNPDVVARLTAEHLYMVLAATLLSLLVALPVSLLLHRFPRMSGPVLGALSLLYTIPSIALLILLLPLFGLNQTSVIVALFLYTQVILVRNLLAGLTAVPPAMVEAAMGLGMNGWQRWWRVQLPTALPVFLAGLRLALIVAVGIATVGAKFGAGGLGTLLFDGVAQNRYDKILAGSLVVALLALLLNGLLLLVEDVFSLERRLARSQRPQPTPA